jgi:hypothetical protein
MITPGGTMELVSADDTAAKERNLSYFRKEEMPVIHVQHIALKKELLSLPNTEGAETIKV